MRVGHADGGKIVAHCACGPGRRVAADISSLELESDVIVAGRPGIERQRYHAARATGRVLFRARSACFFAIIGFNHVAAAIDFELGGEVTGGNGLVNEKRVVAGRHGDLCPVDEPGRLQCFSVPLVVDIVGDSHQPVCAP